MTSGDSTLFAGTEEHSGRRDTDDDDDEGVQETDSLNAGEAVRTVSYRELHSFGLGFLTVLMLLVVPELHAPLTPVFGAACAAVFSGTIWSSRVPDGLVRRWVSKEPHYVWLGGAACAVSAFVVEYVAGVVV